MYNLSNCDTDPQTKGQESFMLKRRFMSGLAFLVMCLAGCNGSPVTQPTAISTTNIQHPYDEQANADQDISAALALAKTDNKYVLLDFGGNWCPDCIVLARFY